MPRYCVTLEETVTYDVIVEAANEDEAGNIAEDVFTNTDVTKLHCVVHDLEVANVEPMAGDCPLTVKMILPASVWEDHPDFPAADWKYEIENNDTRAGYTDWLKAKLEAASAPPAGS